MHYKGYAKFLNAAKKKFSFLTTDYNFKLNEEGLVHPEYFPDAAANLRFDSSIIGIEISWYFAGAMIGIAFYELKDGKVPKDQGVYTRIFDIYNLVEFSIKGPPNSHFLLKDAGDVNFSKIKKRSEIIKKDMDKVLDNLADLLKKFGSRIFENDLSIFSEIMNYQKEQSQMKRDSKQSKL